MSKYLPAICRVIFVLLKVFMGIFLIVGCVEQSYIPPPKTLSGSSTTEGNKIIQSQRLLTPTPSGFQTPVVGLVTTPLLMATADVNSNGEFCDQNPKLIYQGRIFNFRWLRDPNIVYYTTNDYETEWYSFNLSSQATQDVNRDALETLLKLSSHEKILAESAVNGVDQEYYGIYYSQSVKFAIYLKQRLSDGAKPKKAVPGQDIYTDVYLSVDDSNLVFMKTIRGLVQRVFWSSTEDRAILEMEEPVHAYAQVSPNRFWVISLYDMSMVPFFQTKESLVAFGISYDGQWLFYTYQGREGNLRMRNILQETDMELGLSPTAYMWWIDQNRLLSIQPGSENAPDSVVIYDLTNDQVTPISSLPSGYSRRMNIINVSPDFQFLGYRSGNELFIINLCHNFNPNP